jgi:hypothetical protein
MRPCCSVATWWVGLLPVLGLPAALLWAQEPAADTQKSVQSRPTVPRAYRLDINDVLAYQVIQTTRVGAAPPTTTRYRQMVVFDIDDGRNLVVYIGSPEPKSIPASPLGLMVTPGPRQAERHAGPAEHRPDVPGAVAERKPGAAEETEKVQLVWTRYVLGKTFTRNPDGTISFRPPDGQVMPYPLLPLPPVQLNPKERFELTVPDLALGEGKAVQMVGTYRVSPDGKVGVDGHIEPRIVPGGIPELGVIGYDVPATASVVSSIRMSRRPAVEPASQPAHEGAEAGRPHGERSPRPAGGTVAAPTTPPMTSLLIHLVSSKPVGEDLRKNLVATINSAGKSPAPEGESAEQAAGAAGEAGDKGKLVTGNLWDQVEQNGLQTRQTTESAGE